MEDSVDKTLKIVIALVIIMIILSATNKVFFENKVKIPEDKVNPEEILLVDDYNRFYTVSSCVSKYLNYLTTNNTEKLLVLLSNEYKTKNNINETNIYTYIPKITEIYTLSLHDALPIFSPLKKCINKDLIKQSINTMYMELLKKIH